MSGHSKWANIRRRKETQDNKKDKIFSKIIKELNTASQNGGNNPEYNSKLRLVIEKALSYNMSRTIINRILLNSVIQNKRNKNKLKEIIYEGYGPYNIALMINCITDNNNRTVSFIRNILNKNGGYLGRKNSVNYIFKKQIYIAYEYKNNENDILNIAEELKADDIVFTKKIIKIIFSKEKYKFLTKKIKKFTLKPIKIKFFIKPFITKKVDNLIKKKLIDFFSLLKEHKDIKEIYHDAEI
ncbi:hypothetical protein GJT88_02150 [Enterobacteriaceae endosymbiont of Donacia tomentosa]|uniref:YebC/PmpR family DNA-binding transcriptional regulator n=1 Tax=Enterobacteriaceae endosymbiont of Donacia tomentosa TaxID=2675787 RepID=UPI0014494003|nr:YebC/PmpR family DNA-binding transcriptional regulator [Enterobacteriaceae endosymbiont of Donacia tomentosa]QJC31836.1 hypothetical protein GJT88_02150 [Enterobacteriaceae endosymbiont of Donacia tomentosa]